MKREIYYMPNINYTIMHNENKETVVVIDPIISKNKIYYKREYDSLIIYNEKIKVAVLLDLFKELKDITTFLLVEFGTMGLRREIVINL